MDLDTTPTHVRAGKVDLEELGVGVRHLARPHVGLPQEARHGCFRCCSCCRLLPALTTAGALLALLPLNGCLG